MHLFELKVYIEDTDAYEVVFYANYLKFIERARTEWILDLNEKIKDEVMSPLNFMVYEVNMKYLKPAQFQDILLVKTEVVQLGRTYIDLQQDIYLKNNDKKFIESKVRLVYIHKLEGKLSIKKMPQILVNELK